jgi:hypothetical protein
MVYETLVFQLQKEKLDKKQNHLQIKKCKLSMPKENNDKGG